MRLPLVLLTLLSFVDALRLPLPTEGLTRRGAALAAVSTLLVPQVASAKYRPSLAEFKGYGNSPLLDEAKSEGIQTNLSHAQLVANSVEMQEKMCGDSCQNHSGTNDPSMLSIACLACARHRLGRKLTEEEVAAIDAKIRKYYPNAAK